MPKDERVKTRPYTVRELEYHVTQFAKQDPNAPVQVGICICTARVITFERNPTITCPKCQAEVSVLPITVRVK